MKISCNLPVIILFIVGILSFSGCGGGGGSDEGSVVYSTGDKVVYTADSVSFTLVYVEGGFTFPKGQLDDATDTVAEAYWIAETEVTYELWKKVYDWATDAARGANIYTFANAGTKGNGDAGNSIQHPVTEVNWRDCIVWCNAMTEWYNAQKGTSYECVYTYNSNVLHDATDPNCDNAVASPAAKGFRLLTANEWELAARYRGTDTTNVVSGFIPPFFGTDFSAMPTKWTKGNSASGAIDKYDTGLVNDPVAVYKWYYDNNTSSWVDNGTSSTAEVKTKNANTLGLYDMSGNVIEWCFDSIPPNRSRRGGGWESYATFLQIGYDAKLEPDYQDWESGFRIGKSH